MTDESRKTDKIPGRLLNAVRSLTQRRKIEKAALPGASTKEHWDSLYLLQVNLERMADNSDLGMLRTRVLQRLKEAVIDTQLYEGLHSCITSCQRLHEMKMVIRTVLDKKENLTLSHISDIQQRLARLREGIVPPRVSDKMIEKKKNEFIEENKELIKSILNLTGRDLSQWPDQLSNLKQSFSDIFALFKNKEISKLNNDKLTDIKNTINAIATELRDFHELQGKIEAIDFRQLDDPDINIEIREADETYQKLRAKVLIYGQLEHEKRKRLKEEIAALELLYEQIKFELESESISIDDYDVSVTEPSPQPKEIKSEFADTPPPVMRADIVKPLTRQEFKGPLASQFIFRVEPYTRKRTGGDEQEKGVGKVVYFWPVGANVNDNIPLILKATLDGVEGYVFQVASKSADKIIQIQPKKGKHIPPEKLLSVCIKKLLTGDFDQSLSKYFPD